MSELKKIASISKKGYVVVRQVHRFYMFADNVSVLAFLSLLFFIFLIPFLTILFLLLNNSLSIAIKSSIIIDAKNYPIIKAEIEKLNAYVNYFHSFFNADTKILSWFVRPLFPFIKRHIHLQADYRDMLRNKLLELNPTVSGSRFVLIRETELWENRNKSYPYLS